MQSHTYPLLKVEDPFGLSDADWAEISKLQRSYALGGNGCVSEALIELLESDRVRAAGVLRALSPRAVRETIDNEMIRELEVLAGEFKAHQSAQRWDTPTDLATALQRRIEAVGRGARANV